MLKFIKISSVALFLIALGVTTQPGGRFTQQSVAFLMSERVGGGSGSDSLALDAAGRMLRGESLALGARLLKEKCSTCHSVNFVLNSGMLAGEADSTIASMISKSSSDISPRDHKLIRSYLENRLPRE